MFLEKNFHSYSYFCKKIKELTKATFERGFTIVELLVVIAVLGVLASALVAVINPNTQFAKTRDAHRKSDLEQIQRALQLYYNDHSTYPAFCLSPGGGSTYQNDFALNLTSLAAVPVTSGCVITPINSSYITVFPNDPLSKLPLTCSVPNYIYMVSSTGQSYTILAMLEQTSDPQALQYKSNPFLNTNVAGTCINSLDLNKTCQSFQIAGGTNCGAGTFNNGTYNYWVSVP